jgi:cardiolipin synthase
VPTERRIDLEEAGFGPENRVATLPNAVTALRLCCVPLFVWVLFGAHRQTAAAFLLGALGATDWVDGFLARRLHQVSKLGKVLDPTADRILVATAVIAVMVHGAVPTWFGVATLVREGLVAGAVLLLAALGSARIDVLWVGKVGTFALMFAYPAFLLGHGTAGWQVPIRDIAWVTGGIGLALAWVAACSYVGPARRAFALGRAARAGVPTDRGTSASSGGGPSAGTPRPENASLGARSTEEAR